MNSIQAYVQSVFLAISRQDGPRLRELILLSSSEAQLALMPSASRHSSVSPASACSRLPEGWAEFFTLHCAAVSVLHGGNAGDAYDKEVSALQHFLRIFREDVDSWVVHPMQAVVHNLRAVAEASDLAAMKSGKRSSCLADCGDQLRKCFSVSIQAPGNKDKKLAALDIVNVSIKIYFKLNTLRLCKNLIRTVDSRQFAPFDLFPAGQRVTYKFYIGRLAVFDENFEEAEESLNYALRHCHRDAQGNKARILKYLVPVALLLGRLPSTSLMSRYSDVLSPYEPLIQSMKSGDLGLFNSSISNQQEIFIQDGTFLLLEKLEAAVQRRLLRKVWRLHADSQPDKSTQIPLLWFQKALNFTGYEVEMDEVECIAANLIARKYVRGYISHKANVMVVAKNEPFPPLASVALSEGT